MNREGRGKAISRIRGHDVSASSSPHRRTGAWNRLALDEKRVHTHTHTHTRTDRPRLIVRGRQYVRLSATHTQGLLAGWMGSHESVNLQVIPTRRPGRRLMHMPWTRATRQARLKIPRYRLPRNLHEKSAAARVLIAVAVYTGSVAECRLEWWTQAQEGPGFKSQPRRCRVTVLGKLFTPIVPFLPNSHTFRPDDCFVLRPRMAQITNTPAGPVKTWAFKKKYLGCQVFEFLGIRLCRFIFCKALFRCSPPTMQRIC